MKTGIQVNRGKAAGRLYPGEQTKWHAVIGVTSDLPARVWTHKNEVIEGFTKKYGVHRLVYYEMHPDMNSAIAREKQLKKWNRAWKLELIEAKNPEWNDLWNEIVAT